MPSEPPPSQPQPAAPAARPATPSSTPAVVSPVVAPVAAAQAAAGTQRVRTGSSAPPAAAQSPAPPSVTDTSPTAKGAHIDRSRYVDAEGAPKRVVDLPDVTRLDADRFPGAMSRDTRHVPEWGSAQDARKTIMMTAPAQRESPLAEVLEPPKIEVVQHDMPEDGPSDRRLVLVRDSDSLRAASFRVLRHHLLERGQPKVVAVSSARDREGKTTCAINLALALAECARARVLLVDGNLRRPELAGLFRFVPPWCFAEQLAVHREQPLLPWGVVEIKSMWLHVAAVNPRRDPGKLLDAPSFTIAMERLRLGPYDHIVIDCPSVLGGADVNLIQDAADGVLLVARRRKTTARELRQAVEQLTPAKVIGTALLD